jgi:hypothetical protein
MKLRVIDDLMRAAIADGGAAGGSLIPRTQS